MSTETRVTWHGEKAEAAVMLGGVEGLNEAGRIWLERSNQLVPYEVGTLESTGRILLQSETLSVSIAYDTVYAKRMYWSPSIHFQGGRVGRWIERARDEVKDAMLAALGVGLGKHLR